MRAWYAESGARRVFACGPLVAFGAHADEVEMRSAPGAAEIVRFLDRVRNGRGERSLVYVRALFVLFCADMFRD